MKRLAHSPKVKAGFRLRDLKRFVEEAERDGFHLDTPVKSPGKHQFLIIEQSK